MAKAHQRVFALIGALLFLSTSVAVSGVIIWQVHQQSQAEKAIKTAQKAATKAQPNITTQPKEGQLKGTKLANFTPTDKPADELQITDLKEGDGEPVKESDSITAHYTGAYAVNGEIFESSKDSGEPAKFPLSGVIQGWQKGVPGMKVGGVRRLVIPGALAYGDAPAGYTPGSGSRPLGTLVFDIELVKIGQ